MVAHIADEVGENAALREAPPSVEALVAIVVAAARDRLEQEIGQRLQHREVGPRDRRACRFIDVDEDVRDQVPGTRRAVGVGRQRGVGELLYRVPAADARAAIEREGGVCEQGAGSWGPIEVAKLEKVAIADSRGRVSRVGSRGSSHGPA